MTTPRIISITLAAAAAFGVAGYSLWRAHADQELAAAAAANRARAQEILGKVCPVARNAERVRAMGAELAAHAAARTLIWAGPQLLYASDPAFTAPAPLLTGAQRAQPGWVGWAEVDLPCGLSVQRFQKAAP
jgi:hypothetical protein